MKYRTVTSFRSTNPLSTKVLSTLTYLSIALCSACSDSTDSIDVESGPPGAMVTVDPNSITPGDFGGATNPGTGGRTGGGGSAGVKGGSTGVGGSKASTLTTVLKGSLGTTCEADSDCQSPLTCHIDNIDYIGHKQCATSCSSSDSCKTTYGENSFCIGAGICVRGCKTDTDCPNLTECGMGAWCQRGGPGSGIPKCSGSATFCSLLSHSTCYTSLGCTDDSKCTGSSTSCYTYYSSYSCTSQEGCYWSSISKSCSGVSTSCYTMSTSVSCEYQEGCSWSDSCTGVPFACDTMTRGTCESQPGCYLINE